MKILFILSIIETIAFFLGGFLSKTSEMKSRRNEYAIASFCLMMAIGFLAFG